MSASGQVTDWSKAYTLYRPDVFAFLRRRLWGRRELAEDLTQETFTRAMAAQVEMRDPSKVRAYLLRTANNLMISHLRRGSRVAIESDLAPDADLESHADATANDPLTASEAAQLRDRVQQLVAQLPEDQRIAFERGVLERTPYAEIAEEHDWTVAKVKVCVYRARKHLIGGLEAYR